MTGKFLGIPNDLLMIGMVGAGAYLLWQSGTIDKITQGLSSLGAPASGAAPVSGATSTSSSALDLSSSSTQGMVCPDGSAPNANNICPNGLPALPAGQQQLGQQMGQSVIPTISGGSDIGGPNSDQGPTFTDPTTGQTVGAGGQFQVPNFNPFTLGQQIPITGLPSDQQPPQNLCPDGTFPDQQTGKCTGGQSICSAGTRWSPCFQTCRAAGLNEPSPNDPRCVGGGPAPPPQHCPWQYCGPTANWDSNLCQCVPISQPPAQQCPPGYTQQGNYCIQVQQQQQCPAGYTMQNGVCVQNAPAPIQCPAGSTLQNGVCVQQQQQVNCPPGFTFQPPNTCVQVVQNTGSTGGGGGGGSTSTNCSECMSKNHGSCHSECCRRKCMDSSRCKQCLTRCGDYDATPCHSSNVAYAYPAKVVSRSYRTAPQNAIASQLWARRFTGVANRVTTS